MNTAASAKDKESGLADDDALSDKGNDSMNEIVDQKTADDLNIKGEGEMTKKNLEVDVRRISLEPEKETQKSEEPIEDGGGRSSLLENPASKDVVVENIHIDEKPDVAEKNTRAEAGEEPIAEIPKVGDDIVDEFDEPEPEMALPKQETKPSVKEEEIEPQKATVDDAPEIDPTPVNQEKTEEKKQEKSKKKKKKKKKE